MGKVACLTVVQLLTRLMRFAGASGLGLTLDALVYSALNLAGVEAGVANVVSATCGVTFVYFASLRHVFDARGRTTEQGLFASYWLYQALAIPAASGLIALAVTALDGRWLLAKAAVLPVTFLTNYAFMSWLLRPTTRPMTRV